MINVIVADDQDIVREGLKMILSLDEEINVVGEACNGKELLELLNCTVPEVILMDIRMPVLDGIAATKQVKEKYPGIKIIILTTFNEDEFIFEGLKNGADGYILKDSGSKEIVNSIKSVADGGMILNQQVAVKVIKALEDMAVNRPSEDQTAENNNILKLLTPRELDVAKHILQGKSNRAISKALYVTEGTVKNYVSRILEKLELKNRTELVLFLNKSGLD